VQYPLSFLKTCCRGAPCPPAFVANPRGVCSRSPGFSGYICWGEDAEVLDQILARTEGVPLFTEELNMQSMRGFLQYELEFAFHRITGAPTDRKWPPPPDTSFDYHFVMFGSDALPPEDVVPLRGFARVPYVLLAAPKLPVRTVEDLFRYARSNKTPIRYVDSGGTAIRVMENFLSHFGIRGERIPASGDDAYAAVITGRADLMMSTILHGAEVTSTGLVRTLAVTGASRNARLPDVPAIAEFFPDYSDGDWYAVGARNVGAEEMLALADMMKTVDRDPATSVKFRELGVDLFDVGPEDIAKLLNR
jgi:Tripartite tricarboxylate transporter family receptor